MHATRDQLHRFFDANLTRLDAASPCDEPPARVVAAVVCAAVGLLTAAAVLFVVLSVL